MFPLQKSSAYDVANVKSLVASFQVHTTENGSTLFNKFLSLALQPRTPLEVEIAELLKHSEVATETPEGLTVAEQKALEKMNLEEVSRVMCQHCHMLLHLN